MVKTIKGLLQSSSDPHLAVLSYRATPMSWCGLSPSELLMGRKLRTIPQTKSLLTPVWPYLPQFRKDNAQFKAKQKENFYKAHRVQVQAGLLQGSEVVVTSEAQPVKGRVLQSAGTPRSYIVQTQSGEIRRNQSQLNVLLNTPSEPETEVELETSSQPSRAEITSRRIVTRSQTGT